MIGTILKIGDDCWKKRRVVIGITNCWALSAKLPIQVTTTGSNFSSPTLGARWAYGTLTIALAKSRQMMSG